ncbi:MAG: PAS domain S-box protein [Dehalococcoidales bacterium]|nr:PAS domain S-box protein [Dehalococcoidales bacterium]
MASKMRKLITEDIHGLIKGKHPEQALQEALRYVQSIIETMRDPLVVLDDSLRVISANQSFYDIFLVRSEDTEGSLIYELNDGQWDIPRLRELLEEILPKNTGFNDFEIDHFFPGIGRRVMLLNARRIYSEGHKTQRILLGIEDITERKHMEQEVTASEVRYRRLFETAQDGILILDAETAQIEDVNPFLVDMMGYSRQEFLGKDLWEIGPVKDIEASRKAFKELQDKEHIRYEDLPLETRAGKQIQVEFVSNVYPVNGRKVIQCNIRDVTERKKLDHLKDEFIGMVSHELSSPLTIITGSLNTLLSEEEQLSRDETHHLIQNAALAADTLSHLLGNLLELSRAQAERLILHEEPIRADIVVRNTVENITEQYSTHKFVIDFPEGLPLINADPLRLERILYNLLDNARKYSPNGTEIRVFTVEEKELLVIGVSDHGVGISKSDQAKIFIPFERLKPAGFERTKGAGLGLLVCQRLVEAHGGQIRVESTPGKGSTFFFSLPFIRET